MKSEEAVLKGPSPVTAVKCRFCNNDVGTSLLDLGMSPLCESFVDADKANSFETFYPLHALVCESCFLVQLESFVTPDHIFTEYAYFSSYSDSWVAHAKRYCEMITQRLKLDAESSVMEIASNDGYLLQHFVAMNVPVLGIEPAQNVAEVAIAKNIPTISKFFGVDTAKAITKSHGKANLLLGNNVLAHVPDLNDFVAGMKILLADDGEITMEFPHLHQLMSFNQFDTIYHEHFCYFSLLSVERVFRHHGLCIYDVEELTTHGGSLRIFAKHLGQGDIKTTDRFNTLRDLELAEGYDRIDKYAKFTSRIEETKREILSFLIGAKRSGKTVVGYGAPGKGNTLLNYCGIRTDFIDFTVDRNPYKHGKFTPGTHIPICPPQALDEAKPDYVFILPWNLADEIIEQLSHIRDWGGKFVLPIPSIKVL